MNVLNFCLHLNDVLDILFSVEVDGIFTIFKNFEVCRCVFNLI